MATVEIAIEHGIRLVRKAQTVALQDLVERIRQTRREPSGRRPFLVLSPSAYNSKTSLAVRVPITSRRKGYAFEVEVEADGRVDGVALADRVESLG